MSEHTSEAPRIITRDTVGTAVVRGTQRMDELTAFYDRAFPAVAEALGEQGLRPGDAFGLYGAMNDDTAELEVGFVVDGDFRPTGEVEAGELPGGEYATFTHVGSYGTLSRSWEALGKWIQDQDRTSGQTVFEIYRDDPTEADPEAMRTELYWSLF
ncbi:GyrI-like domain-containing protein [Tessaracoccus sp. OS52]|uniref:GyrI-like domain-containing protein n=1 Tax=Tessaracoccus sp. OS52 TaxID=2886691 RepID=UPI001D0FC5EF|nr:GyrI-like domain-containing protein [Tessaracoccus sp. OS52]MCC2594514.1 GyrI-like domain-containing protein [Tessaracoccus sp. OS52]